MTLDEYKIACRKFYGIYIFSFVPLGLITITVIKYLFSASSAYIAAFGQFLRYHFGEGVGGAMGGAISGLTIGLVICVMVIPTMKLLKKVLGVKCPACRTLIVDKASYEYAVNNFKCLKCKSVIITKT